VPFEKEKTNASLIERGEMLEEDSTKAVRWRWPTMRYWLFGVLLIASCVEARALETSEFFGVFVAGGVVFGVIGIRKVGI
jgi:hypothetical protein